MDNKFKTFVNALLYEFQLKNMGVKPFTVDLMFPKDEEVVTIEVFTEKMFKTQCQYGIIVEGVFYESTDSHTLIKSQYTKSKRSCSINGVNHQIPAKRLSIIDSMNHFFELCVTKVYKGVLIGGKMANFAELARECHTQLNDTGRFKLTFKHNSITIGDLEYPMFRGYTPLSEALQPPKDKVEKPTPGPRGPKKQLTLYDLATTIAELREKVNLQEKRIQSLEMGKL